MAIDDARLEQIWGWSTSGQPPIKSVNSAPADVLKQQYYGTANKDDDHIALSLPRTVSLAATICKRQTPIQAIDNINDFDEC